MNHVFPARGCSLIQGQLEIRASKNRGLPINFHVVVPKRHPKRSFAKQRTVHHGFWVVRQVHEVEGVLGFKAIQIHVPVLELLVHQCTVHAKCFAFLVVHEPVVHRESIGLHEDVARPTKRGA